MRIIHANKLLIKLFFVILINALLASLVFFLLVYYVYNTYFQDASAVDPAFVNRLYLLILFVSILTFIVGFAVMVRHKIKQISYLAQEIDRIASGNLGHQVVIKGNDEITSLGANMNRMSLQLKELFEKERAHEQERHQLISNLSHDLRTPLTSVRGYVQLLHDRPGENDQAYLRVIEEKTQQLERLLDQLSEVDRLYDGRIVMRPELVNLSLLTTQLIHEYRLLFEMEDLQLLSDIEPDLYVMADMEKVIRTLQNLLANALKYTPKMTSVHVVARLNPDSKTIIWEIQNETDEPTIRQMDKLFNRTYRVDISRGETSGEGLGLSIAKQIMKLNNGDLIVKRQGKHNISFQAIFPSFIKEDK
ncbi:HAMP domain-containing histidine kinase [Jeotgalibacillus sp. S-D1]|uniref:HAMP domain-containing sensor histidine kinase n=1 Tax=Jeotgalibacillus sp. S-D1 TaxID=2552189 RepID=UPI00105A079B|nr:HAMP domain-containing sensor histidine kinase [Jeotgalibacillus sp. S-D1]TDL31908.1 HAMP domain-containing histidine kinase [Jeotgalibacillus sp. S-D1]